MSRVAIGFLMAIALASVGVGCDLPRIEPPTAEIEYWRTLPGPAADAQETLRRRYEAGPGMAVNSEFQGGYGDLATKLTAAIVSGNGPHVSQLGTFEIREFAKAGALVDLRPYIAGNIPLDTSGWPETMLEAGAVNGGIYWLPFNVSIPILYYNEERFAAAGLEGPPETWDQLFDYAERLSVRGPNGAIDKPGLALWRITWPLVSAIWSEGGAVTNRDYTNVTLDDPVTVELFRRVQVLIRSGAATMPNDATGGHRAAFLRGDAAMILDSPAPYADIMANAEGFTPKAAPYPSGKNGRVLSPGGGGLVIPATCPEKDRLAAWNFVHFMLQDSSIAYFARATGYAAFTEGSQTLAADWLDTEDRRAWHDSINDVRADFSINMSPSVRDAFDRAYLRIMIQGADPLATLREADATAEREIQRAQ